MRFLIIFYFLLSFAFTNANANEINNFIKKNNISQKHFAIYAENLNSGKIIYSKNIEKPMRPASLLKVLTFGASYLTLGSDYKIETAFHLNNNDLYLKLGADALLTSKDLNNLIKELKSKIDISKIENVYVDDLIFDKEKYPATWLEEDFWPTMSPISPYTIDNNITKISINRSSLATKIDIIQDDEYKYPIINELKLDNKKEHSQEIKITREYGENSPILTFRGTIQKDCEITLPVLNPKLNFEIKFQKALEKNKIKYLKKFETKKTPNNAVKIASVSHNLDDFSKKILVNSNNYTAEVLFKIAGAKYINYANPATLNDSINMFNDFYSDFLEKNIIIKDGSGVSRENQLTLNFYKKAFKLLSEKMDIISMLANANEGTMQDRLLFLQNNLKAKTGNLKGTSSLISVFQSSNQNKILYISIFEDSIKRTGLIKSLEERLIGLFYNKY